MGRAFACRGWRDGYYWKAKERRESGEDKREFEDSQAGVARVRTAKKTMTGVHLEQNRQVYSVEEADTVI